MPAKTRPLTHFFHVEGGDWVPVSLDMSSNGQTRLTLERPRWSDSWPIASFPSEADMFLIVPKPTSWVKRLLLRMAS
jgi:hypothetical protein